MGKKYLETKNSSLESSVLGVWKAAIEEGDARETAVVDGRTKSYKTHRAKLETARQRREEKKINKEEVDLDEGKMKELHGYIEDGKSAEWIAKKMGVDVKTIKSLMKEEIEIDPRKLPDMRDALLQIRTEKHDTHVDPKDRDELDKETDGEGGVETAKKMKRAQEPEPGQMAEASGGKEAYKKFFDAALKKFKVSSPAELKGDQKKKFFDYVDKNWEADNEKAEDAMSQVREFKIQSMKAALAQVWGMEEGKNPFKKEDDDKEVKKNSKTETGKKAAVIDLNPKIDD
jgi:hypothetical protein